MDLVSLDINSRVPFSIVLTTESCIIPLACTLASPFRVIGTNYQLSSAKDNTYNNSHKTVKFLTSKSYKLDRELKPIKTIPVYKSFFDYFLFLKDKRMYKHFWRGNMCEMMYQYGNIRSKHLVISCYSSGNHEYPRNIHMITFFFLLIDLWSQYLEEIVKRHTYSDFHTPIVEKIKFRDLLIDYAHDKANFNHVNVYAITSLSKMVSWYYVMMIWHDGYSLSKAFDIFLIHTLLYPLSTLKSRMDIQWDHPLMQPFRYKSIRQGLVKIYRDEGIINGWYRGFFHNSIYSCFVRFWLIPMVYFNSFENEWEKEKMRAKEIREKHRRILEEDTQTTD